MKQIDCVYVCIEVVRIKQMAVYPQRSTAVGWVTLKSHRRIKASLTVLVRMRRYRVL